MTRCCPTYPSTVDWRMAGPVAPRPINDRTGILALPWYTLLLTCACLAGIALTGAAYAVRELLHALT